MFNIMKSTFVFIVLMITSIGLMMYFSFLAFKYPLIGLEVNNQEGNWVVKAVYENGWAYKKGIKRGDTIEQINGIDPNDFKKVSHFGRVEMAESITIKSRDQLEGKTFTVSYDGFVSQLIFYLLLPFLFSLATMLVSMYLFLKKGEEDSAIILIWFLLSLGLSYLSATASSRVDVLGRIVNTITFSGSMILFLHFLKSYLSTFFLQFIKNNHLRFLYIIYIMVVVTVAWNPFLDQRVSKMIELSFLLFLLGVSLSLLIIFYSKYKEAYTSKSVVKTLLFTMAVAFGPFITLYAIPYIFFEEGIVSAEWAAVFLFFIPAGFVYLQLVERLFDIDFYLGRLRYYTMLALPFSSLIALISLSIKDFKNIPSPFLGVFGFSFLVTIIFLYVKEYVDYQLRDRLFFQKGYFGINLSSFFKKAKNETKVTRFVEKLASEIKNAVNIEEVGYVEMCLGREKQDWSISRVGGDVKEIIGDLLNIKWGNVHTGSLITIHKGFCLVVGEDIERKYLIVGGFKRNGTLLNIQEKMWLETMASFSGLLIDNIRFIEGVAEGIGNLPVVTDADQKDQPAWLSRELFSLSEKERATLSSDLHDTILQDLLQLLRDVEVINEKLRDSSVKDELYFMKEKILDNIHLVRETCSELRPPLLNELGIIQSLQHLIEKVKLRAPFLLFTEFDPAIKKMEPEMELAIFRIVQELLNNAMKHSQASEVRVELKRMTRGVRLLYSDNGVGFDLSKLKNSYKTMGIFGVKERVHSIGGEIKIESGPNLGVTMSITLKERND